MISETTSKTSVDKIENPDVGENTSSVEGFDRELSDGHQTEKASDLSARSIVGPVEIRSLTWSNNHVVSFRLGEPRLKNIEVFFGLISPSWLPLLDLMGRNTETNKLFILPIISDLIVDHSSLTIIISVLIGLKYVILTCSSWVWKFYGRYLRSRVFSKGINV